MKLNPSETELTTAATDALLALLCIGLALTLSRADAQRTSKRTIWTAVFGLLATGSILGAVAHGLDLRDSVRAALWKPLYLSLGLTVALFVVGALGDWRGERTIRVALPWALAAAVGFFAVTQVASGGFWIFIAYEAVAMVGALLIYAALSLRRAVAGAGLVTMGIALTLVAAVIQVSTLTLRIVWPFDHNGLFHLVQIVAVLVMAAGLRQSMKT